MGSVCLESENFAQAGRGAGVDEEGAFICAEVLPVSAAERGETVDRDKALVTLPPAKGTQQQSRRLGRHLQVGMNATHL